MAVPGATESGSPASEVESRDHKFLSSPKWSLDSRKRLILMNQNREFGAGEEEDSDTPARRCSQLAAALPPPASWSRSGDHGGAISGDPPDNHGSTVLRHQEIK